MAKKIPPALNLYSEACDVLTELEADEAGKVIQAGIAYYRDGVFPDDLSKIESLAFALVRNGIDYAQSTYEERCRKNAENAKSRYNKLD